jgi:hypothetical protein
MDNAAADVIVGLPVVRDASDFLNRREKNQFPDSSSLQKVIVLGNHVTGRSIRTTAVARHRIPGPERMMASIDEWRDARVIEPMHLTVSSRGLIEHGHRSSDSF